MGEEYPWGTPSKVYFSDKPLLEGNTDWQELDCNTIEFNSIEPLEKSDSGYKIDDFKGKSLSLKFEVKLPKKHLPRKKKKALKKLVLPYAEYLYEQGLAGRRQQFVTIGWLRIWVKVNRNKLKKRKMSKKMKAIIEIPDELIREAGRALMVSHPNVTPFVTAALERLKNMGELLINLDDTSNKGNVVASTAMLCVTQILGDIAKEYERN